MSFIKNTHNKVAKERFAWDNNLIKRDKYTETFSHSPYYTDLLEEHIQAFFKNMNGKVLLEIGSNAWIDYIHKYGFTPAKVYCLNISVTELELGRKFISENSVNFPVEFIICDGSVLPFQSEKFDAVFGGAILHHLNFSKAIREIQRVCKPTGQLLFHEPLGINPVAKLIRLLTPAARTEDETPLTIKYLKEMNNLFDCQSFYSQLFSVLASAFSKRLLSNPRNFINSFSFWIDETTKRWIPGVKYLFRELLIVGRVKNK